MFYVDTSVLVAALVVEAHESFNILPISANHFHLAARFADRHDLSIKAGDTLHAAIASDNRVTLCTLDRRLAKAGLVLGVMTHLL